MAERVRALMEAMVPELEDLTRRGVCTEQEAKQLAKRRERFEYLLHRCAARHAFFAAPRSCTALLAYTCPPTRLCEARALHTACS